MTKVGWGQRLRLLRKAVSKSRKDYSGIYGRGPTAIQEHENEVGSPQLTNLIRLKLETRVNLNWLATGDGTMFGESPFTDAEWAEIEVRVEEVIATGLPTNQKAASIVNYLRSRLDTPIKKDTIPFADVPGVMANDRGSAARGRKKSAS